MSLPYKVLLVPNRYHYDNLLRLDLLPKELFANPHCYFQQHRLISELFPQKHDLLYASFQECNK